MSVRYSRFRTLLFTFMVGLAAVRLAGYFEEIAVNVPKVKSKTPIIIRLCPEWGIDKGYVESKGYVENGNLYFSKEKAMDCTPGGGSGPHTIGD